MDGDRFDDLTRTLASGRSRRSMVRGIMGTAIGGLLAAVGIADVEAKPETRGPCKAPNTKCGMGKGAVCCTSSEVCRDGACCTPEDAATTCDGQCGMVTNNCGQEIDCGLCPRAAPPVPRTRCLVGYRRGRRCHTLR